MTNKADERIVLMDNGGSLKFKSKADEKLTEQIEVIKENQRYVCINLCQYFRDKCNRKRDINCETNNISKESIRILESLKSENREKWEDYSFEGLSELINKLILNEG